MQKERKKERKKVTNEKRKKTFENVKIEEKKERKKG